MKSEDATVKIEIEGVVARGVPRTSVFLSLNDASEFFEGGALGYSVTSDPGRLDGLKSVTREWAVEPLEIRRIYSSYFFDQTKFPKSSIEFDHALIMKNLEHEWHGADDLYL